MKRKFLYMTLIALAILMTLGRCAPAAPTPTPTPRPPTAAPTKAVDVKQTVTAGAVAEGTVMIYTSLTESEVDGLSKKFNARYPFIKVQSYYKSSTDLVQDALAQAKDGKLTADVFEVDATDWTGLYDAKLLTSYKSSESESYAGGARHPWDYYVVDRIKPLVVAYNTKLVKSADIPRRLSDLADAKWAGKIVVERDDWPMLPNTIKIMGEKEALAFWAKIAELRPIVVTGHGNVTQKISAGEALVSPMAYSDRVEALKKQGEPVEWVNTDPVYANVSVVSVAAKAPHPNAARMFVDWLLSEEGQTEMAKIGRVPSRTSVKADPPSLTEGVKFYFGDPALVGNPKSEFRAQYFSMFGIKE